MQHIPVSGPDLERSLAVVEKVAVGQAEGVFGPNSIIWRVDRETLVFVGAGRAFLMQLAHPWVAKAIADHSSALVDPIGRFHRTFRVVFTLVFGSLHQALLMSRRLHRRHSTITGSLSGHPANGSPVERYFANELSALMWVHATLVDTALKAYELVLPPLSSEERERYYRECQLLGALFGIPVEAQPPDWLTFTTWLDETIASDRLQVGPDAKRIGIAVLRGAGRLPVPRWYSDITASLLPEHMRCGFELRFGKDEQRRATTAIRTIRRGYPMLPERLRYVGPYQEGISRIAGRQPDFITRALNRVWMSRSSMQG
jgi:uncharacterized protein (DUF2236 family)